MDWIKRIIMCLMSCRFCGCTMVDCGDHYRCENCGNYEEK